MVAFILLVIGGLNWLLIGLFDWGIANLTDPISPVLTQAIYVLVGLSAIYEVVTHKANCRMCASSSTAAMPM
jgi:uncharacterized membrane protein YuzA (DUF378 family)